MGMRLRTVTHDPELHDTLAALECVGRISHLPTSEAYYPQGCGAARPRHGVIGGNSD